MSAHNELLAEARSSDVDKFYLEMGAEASSSDPMAASIAAQVHFALDHLHVFLESNKGKPVALVTVRCLRLVISNPLCRLVLTLLSPVWWHNYPP